MLVTLRNEFHRTTTTIRPIDGRVSHRAGRNTWKHLCGVKGCVCGNILGSRGKQYHNGNELRIEPDFSNGGDRPGNHSATVTELI